MANPVVHFEVQADDVERAKGFYEKVFGWKVTKMMSAGEGGMMDYWGLETRPAGEPGINGGLYKRDPNRVIKTFDCTITVENIDKAIADVKANGGTIESMPQGGEKGEIPNVGWFARGIDTEGNIFGLLQPTAWQAK